MRYFIHNNKVMQNCIEYIQRLPLDKNYVVYVEKRKSKRSLNQNSLWHYWVKLMADAAGCSDKLMKDDIKEAVLGLREVVSPLTGEVKYIHYETGSLEKEDFTKLMIETQVLASEFYGLILPSPDDAPKDLWER